jgi:uncharacterized protein YxeA
MKKTIITIITLMLTLSVFGQAWKEARANEYAAEAQKAFKLNEEQTEQIKDLWIARSDAFSEIGQQRKSGTIDETKQKELNNKCAKTYMEKMTKVLGCKPQEFRDFNNRTMDKIRS